MEITPLLLVPVALLTRFLLVQKLVLAFLSCSEVSARLPSCSEVSSSEVSATSSGKALKRKRKVLTIEQKVEILNELSSGVSATILSERYGVGKSTVYDIKKNKDSILNFKRKVTDMGMNKKLKIIKLGDDMKHDEAVYI